MNWIDEIASELCEQLEGGIVGGTPEYFRDITRLYRTYALLVLVKGVKTTNEDIHNVWAIWAMDSFPLHSNLKPYDELSDYAKSLDNRYRDAVVQIAERLSKEAADPPISRPEDFCTCEHSRLCHGTRNANGILMNNHCIYCDCEKFHFSHR